jgi:hypothetical protein
VDLQLFVGVIRRHRAIVIVGVVLAVLLAFFSYVRIAGLEDWKPTLQYREDEQWQSQNRVLLTLPGFSSGSTLLHSGASAEAIQRAEDRLASQTVLFAGLVTGDPVTAIVKRSGPIHGRVVAQAAQAAGGTATLPIVAITAVAPSAAGANDLANRYAEALSEYVESGQSTGDVSLRQRVSLQTLNRADRAELAAPRSRTLPVIVLLAVLSATIGLAFVLENVRNRPPTAGTGVDQKSAIVISEARRAPVGPDARGKKRPVAEPVLPPVLEPEQDGEAGETPTSSASEVRSA